MTPGERVAQVAHEILDPGPMGDTMRGDEYEAFLDAAFGNGARLRKVATSCAVFAASCLIHAGVQGPRPWPKKRAITTWLGVRGFVEDEPETDLIEGSWIPADECEPEPGDVFYICSSSGRMHLGGGRYYTWTRWQDAANGHVGILIDGAGPMWITGEGGGSPGGTICRRSEQPKNIHELTRTLRGFWRPALMVNAPRPFAELRHGMRGPSIGELQLRLLKLGYSELGSVDSSFGKLTRAAVQRFQAEHQLEPTGIVDRQTWQRIESSTEPAGIPAINGNGGA